MTTGEKGRASFEEFVGSIEPRLRAALSASLGSERGREATADALSYGWENWDRVGEMDNPAGYLYKVGRDRASKAFRKSQRVVLMPVEPESSPWVEPRLPEALASLPEKQRVVVMLLHCFDWTMTEAADFLGVSKSSIQTHAERGLAALRTEMGVAM